MRGAEIPGSAQPARRVRASRVLVLAARQNELGLAMRLPKLAKHNRSSQSRRTRWPGTRDAVRYPQGIATRK